MICPDTGKEIRFRPYGRGRTKQVTLEPQPVQRPAKPVATPAGTLSPELRQWLDLRVQTLAYWTSLPDEQLPLLTPEARARDLAVLAGLRALLA